MTPPQATAGPISEAGGTAGKPYLRKGKTLPKNEGDKEKKKKSLRISPATLRWEKKEGGAPGAGAEISLYP